MEHNIRKNTEHDAWEVIDELGYVVIPTTPHTMRTARQAAYLAALLELAEQNDQIARQVTALQEDILADHS